MSVDPRPCVGALQHRPAPAERDRQPCKIWTGSTNGKYGHIRLRPGIEYVHRRAWRLAHGPIPDGMNVCHRCDVPLCYEVSHLFLGTQADNMRDMKAKGRDRHGETHHNAKLTQADVEAIRATTAPSRKGFRSPNSRSAMARHFGVSQSVICEIVNGKAWAR